MWWKGAPHSDELLFVTLGCGGGDVFEGHFIMTFLCGGGEVFVRGVVFVRVFN